MPIIHLLDKMEWEDPPRGYYLTDVKQKTLHIDVETGATWALLRFPPGVADKMHTHPEAKQLCFLLSGELEEPNGSLLKASGDVASVFEKGEPHGRTNFTKETLILFYWDGSPDPDVVE
jgi:hypothetical protein